MNPVLCAAVGLLPLPPGELPAPDGGCLYVDIDAAGRLEANLPDDGISVLATVPRGRAEIGVYGQQYGARFAVEPVRSGGLTSAIGIDGESIVARYQIAEAWIAAPRLGLRAGAGIVDDPWVVTANDAWLLRAVAPTLGEEAGWMDRSDLGLIGSWTAPGGLASAAVSFTNGEGARFVERNNGKDTTGLLTVRPLDGGDRLTVTVMGRDGSRGLSSAVDRRLGARLTSALGPADLGAEVLKAWGVGGDADQVPYGWSAWARGSLPADLSVFARADQTTAIPGEGTSTATTLRAGVGWQPAEPARLIAGVEQRSTGAQATAVAGADGTAQTTTLYVLLSVRHRGALTLDPMENRP